MLSMIRASIRITIRIRGKTRERKEKRIGNKDRRGQSEESGGEGRGKRERKIGSRCRIRDGFA